jgi:hypothetical protein
MVSPLAIATTVSGDNGPPGLVRSSTNAIPSWVSGEGKGGRSVHVFIVVVLERDISVLLLRV